MEAAAGGIAVISLGLQLVHTVKRVKNFVDGIRDAPSELANLATDLERYHLMLAKVNDLVGTRRSLQNSQDSTDLMESIVRGCKPNIDKLEALMDKLQKKLSHGGRRWTTWASISSMVKKDEIERYQKGIKDNLANLNMAVNIGTSESM